MRREARLIPLEEIVKRGTPYSAALARHILADREVRSAEIQAEFAAEDEMQELQRIHALREAKLAAARAEVDCLRAQVEKLRPYTRHMDGGDWCDGFVCEADDLGDSRCDCGLTFALEIGA